MLGSPCGVPVFLPFAASGENHLEMRLGMLGIPVEPTPHFPENDSDLSKVPKAVIEVLKRALSENLYASGRHFSMFTYRDGSFILYRYVKECIHPEWVTVHSVRQVEALLDTQTGERIPVRKTSF